MAAHSYSVNTVPSIHDYIISEDLLAGQRLDGRMSAVRRFFCLFVTFDFLFISLMWLICVMVSYVSNVYIKSSIAQLEKVTDTLINTKTYHLQLFINCIFCILLSTIFIKMFHYIFLTLIFKIYSYEVCSDINIFRCFSF